eukprot:gene14846-16388_t
MLSEVTWENEMGDMNVDESWSFFRDKVITAIKDYIPLLVPKKPNAKPPYWNKNLTRHVRKKQRNMTSKELRKNERLYESSLTKEFKEKPKQFYGYVRNKMKTKANVPQLKRSDGSMTESDQQKADVLNEFFQSVFVEENTSKLPDFDIRTDNIIEDIEFTVEDVKKKLDQLKEDKAAGPDCIPPKFLKELRNVLALPLYLIFRKSLDESYLPSEWKTANITSIFKKGSKKAPGNYRPISLTSVACKIMESIIRDAAVEHSNKNVTIASGETRKQVLPDLEGKGREQKKKTARESKRRRDYLQVNRNNGLKRRQNNFRQQNCLQQQIHGDDGDKCQLETEENYNEECEDGCVQGNQLRSVGTERKVKVKRAKKSKPRRDYAKIN